MCIPHAPSNTLKGQKRERHVNPKASVPFNKKLLEPDPDFKDERTYKYIPKKDSGSLLHKLFSFLN